MQRRIQQADGHGQLVHDAQDRLEVALLHGQELVQGLAPPLLAVGQDHLPDRVDALLLEEHVLGAAQADALGAEVPADARLLGQVGVGLDAEPAGLVHPAHEPGKAPVGGRAGGFAVAVEQHPQHVGRVGHELALDHLSGAAVQGQPVPFPEHGAADAGFAGAVVHAQGVAAHHAHGAELPRHQRGVGGHAAPRREDALGGLDAADVLRAGLHPAQDDVLPSGAARLRVGGVEHDPAGGRTRTRRQPARQHPAVRVGRRLGGLVEDRAQDLAEVVGLDALQRLLAGDGAGVGHVHGDAHRGEAGALAGAGLQQPEPAVLDGELQVLHVPVAFLQHAADALQLAVGVALYPGQRADGLRRADAGHHVLALGVHQELAVEAPLARRRVAGEGHPGAGGVAHVAEHHGLDVDRGAPAFGDAVHLPVGHGAVVVPRPEHRADGAPELLHRVLGEGRAPLPPHLVLELGHQVPQVLGREPGVVGDAAGGLPALQQRLEHVVGLGLVGLHAQHHIAVHLHEAAVGVVDEARVAGAPDHAGHGVVVEAQVQHRVHHPGHGLPRARAHRHQQGVVAVAEAAAHDLLHPRHGGGDLPVEALGVASAVLVVVGADRGGDGEARRHRNAHASHLVEARALAAQDLAHGGPARGLAGAERVDVPGHQRSLVRGSMRRRISSTSRSTGTRTWVMASRSRRVTVWSVMVSWSTVTPKGVPISSCRR